MLRIGINLGDVIGEGSDIYGDGVNVAARLEALAEPGGVCVSAKVHEELRGKGNAAFEDMGEVALKNIVRPVRVYRVGTSTGQVGGRAATTSAARPSIAVLPFDNLSGDPSQQYLSDGITEDITTELSSTRSTISHRRRMLTVPSDIQFGGCDGKVPNCLPTPRSWNYMVRLYRPHEEILNGSWKFPEAQPIRLSV